MKLVLPFLSEDKTHVSKKSDGNTDLKHITLNFVQRMCSTMLTDWDIITFDVVNLSKNFNYDLSFRQIEQVWPLIHLSLNLLSKHIISEQTENTIEVSFPVTWNDIK